MHHEGAWVKRHFDTRYIVVLTIETLNMRGTRVGGGTGRTSCHLHQLNHTEHHDGAIKQAALAIWWAVGERHYYLASRQFTLVSDW